MKETNSYKIYVNGSVDYSNIPKTALEPLTKKILEAILQQLKDVRRNKLWKKSGTVITS